MSESTNQYVSLATAMLAMEVTDEKEFIATAKRHGCYRKIGGVTRINLPELQRFVEEDFARADEQAKKRKAVTRDAGSDFGLTEARLKQAPGRLAAKTAKIAAAEADVKTAENPYQRRQAEKKVQKLRDELAKLEAGQQRDLLRRAEFLGGEEQ